MSAPPAAQQAASLGSDGPKRPALVSAGVAAGEPALKKPRTADAVVQAPQGPAEQGSVQVPVALPNQAGQNSLVTSDSAAVRMEGAGAAPPLRDSPFTGSIRDGLFPASTEEAKSASADASEEHRRQVVEGASRRQHRVALAEARRMGSTGGTPLEAHQHAALAVHMANAVPEIGALREMLRVERSLDAAIARVRATRESLGRSSVAPPESTLLIRVYNTWTPNVAVAADGPGSTGYALSNTQNEELLREPAGWALRIDGWLVEDMQPGDEPHHVQRTWHKRRRLSSILQRVSIQIHDKEHYGERCGVEWTRGQALTRALSSTTASIGGGSSAGSSTSPDVFAAQGSVLAPASSGSGEAADGHVDGFEIRREGSTETDVTIQLWIDHEPPVFVLSDALQAVVKVPGGAATRSRVVLLLYYYVYQVEKLFDREDHRTVICNDALEKLFGRERVAFHDIPSLIADHLLPPEPLIIRHRVSFTPAENAGKVKGIDASPISEPTVLEIPFHYQNDSAAGGGKNKTQTDASHAELERKLAPLDSEMSVHLAELHRRKRKLAFMQQFARDPVDFLSVVHAQMLADATLGSSGDYDREDERRTSFYEGSHVDAAVEQYLSRLVVPRLH
jgi:SWIB/MDM2 domain